MMKTAIVAVGSLAGLFVLAHAIGFPTTESNGESQSLIQRMHGTSSEVELLPEPSEEATVSMAQNDDFYLCNDPFFSGIFESMQSTYEVGIENVTVEMLEQDTFGFIRAWPAFTEEEKTGWVEHIKDIPRQFVEIIQEDNAVLDNCDNFSVAMVGPP